MQNLFSVFRSYMPKATEETFKAFFAFNPKELQIVYDTFVGRVIAPKWFLITLEWLTNYPKHHVQHVYWNISRRTLVGRLWKTVLFLSRLLPDFDFDDRLEEEPAKRIFKDIKCIVDGVEIRIRRPSKRRFTKKQNWIHQKTFFSNKKKMHAMKYQVVVTLRKGKIINVSRAYRGRVHDKKIFDDYIREHGHEFGEQEHLGDLGYVGVPEIFTPFKKPRGGELEQYQKTINKVIGAARVTVENVIGRIKRFDILNHTFRHPLVKHEDVFIICAKLANLHLRFHPVRKCDEPLLDV